MKKDLLESIKNAHDEIMEEIKKGTPFEESMKRYYEIIKKHFENYDEVFSLCVSEEQSENGYKIIRVNFDKLLINEYEKNEESYF